jgi:hypothetical protein
MLVIIKLKLKIDNTKLKLIFSNKKHIYHQKMNSTFR